MLEELVAEALKEACRRAGSQGELARMSGLSPGQISDYLCGRRKITNMTIGTLGKVFPELKLHFFDGFVSVLKNPIEEQIFEIVRSLSDTDKAKCLKIIAANFPDGRHPGCWPSTRSS